VDEREGRACVAGLRRAALTLDDPSPTPGVTPDPDDDYLVALARAAAADLIVSGDGHLTGLKDAQPPVVTPRRFADLLRRRD
jgi:predicted nucleic acid-binding protein